MKKINELISKIGFKKSHINRNLLILVSLFLLSTLLIMLFSIFVIQNVLSNSYLGQKEKQERFYYWMEKVEEYPNSPDVLYNGAISAKEVDKKETALKLLKRSIELDPLFDDAKTLQDEIISDIR